MSITSASKLVLITPDKLFQNLTGAIAIGGTFDVNGLPDVFCGHVMLHAARGGKVVMEFR